MSNHPRTATTVALFPGQGSQQAEMGAEVARRRPDLHRAATAMCGGDPFARLDRGGRFLQPAIFCASVTAWDALHDGAGRPPAVAATAGHSLGELAALTAAGALDELDGLWLAVLRGRLFDEAFAAAGDPGAMLALVGREVAGPADDLATTHGLTVANDNGPGQVVLSGPTAAIAGARADALDRGLAAIDLDVPGAMHGPVLAPVVADLAAALSQVEIREPAVPVHSCASAASFIDVRRELAEAVVRPVRFADLVRGLAADGAATFLEPGPGRVLTGLVRRILRPATLPGGTPVQEPVRA